jgi:hypothetical protein
MPLYPPVFSVGPRVGLDDIEKKNLFLLPGIEPQLLGRPACSVVGTLTEMSSKLFNPPVGNYNCVSELRFCWYRVFGSERKIQAKRTVCWYNKQLFERRISHFNAYTLYNQSLRLYIQIRHYVQLSTIQICY